jgi:hypothetical protein
MGLLNSNHIQAFVKGKRIKRLMEAEGCFYLHFTNGESLRLYSSVKTVRDSVTEIIATPYDKKGSVKQSTEILASK